MATEVFNNIGQAEMREMHSENPNFKRQFKREEENDFESSLSSDKVERLESEDKSASKNISDAKKEFLKHLENDSLTLDTCDKLTHDWKKK